ncbi:Uncharacterised protein (plasmid) [Tsukamurella tyrosinosolvens]|uniref:Uncharacterized protein n=1 Tax=Tsukamurella tyrosinosolvens TaxID=57704 RepID=A0A1H4VB89_TSUTY|nr:hypothetical protein [Tsukamurella tyrosinosolvens]KXO91011.1 hypothetical protein AXK58_21515 [Tsukamurella tyrosinosolvens]SEC78372.1 hypothetical protein SAMN04489793_3189 [Tsukamurella tyrosinosolvens]VEH90596.1 Uncharacterised protein [Tsukamurella tyrosinosolvens]
MNSPLIPAQDIIDVADALRQIRVPEGEQLVVEVTESGITAVTVDRDGRRAAGYGTRRFTPVQEVRRG